MTTIMEETDTLLAKELQVIGKTLKWGAGDPWVRSIGYSPESRTLTFEFRPPCSCNDASALLLPPLRLCVYFPESASDPPFCFSDGIKDSGDDGDSDSEGASNFEEAAAAVAEAANKKLTPLAKGSILLMLSVLQGTVASHRRGLWSVAEIPTTTMTTTATAPTPTLRALGAPAWAHRYAEGSLHLCAKRPRLVNEIVLQVELGEHSIDFEALGD